jgi:biopolymer transport protein ExbD
MDFLIPCVIVKTKDMAQLNEAGENTTGRKRAGVKRMHKNNMRIDMTPMVDLGFLLITFFVITTELSKPTAMDIAMTKDSDVNQTELGDSYALTVIPNGDKMFYYEGAFDKARKEKKIIETTTEGLRKIIVQKQLRLDDKAKYQEGREGLMLLLKPSATANYKSVIDVLDECTITQTKKYALLKISNEEKEWLYK